MGAYVVSSRGRGKRNTKGKTLCSEIDKCNGLGLIAVLVDICQSVFLSPVFMTPRLAPFCLSLVIGLSAMPTGVAAQGLELDELRAGVFYHSAYGGFLPTGNNWDFARFEDIKFAALFASPDIEAFHWIGSPRIEVGTTLNLQGRENLIHANLNWQIGLFDTPLYLEVGFGAALTDGALDGAARPARNMGCPLNFYDAFGIGAHINETTTVTLRYEHISNLEICSPNDGLSNVGVMVGVKF